MHPFASLVDRLVPNQLILQNPLILLLLVVTVCVVFMSATTFRQTVTYWLTHAARHFVSFKKKDGESVRKYASPLVKVPAWSVFG